MYSNIKLWFEYSFRLGELLNDENDENNEEANPIFNNLINEVKNINIKKTLYYNQSLKNILEENNISEIKNIINNANNKIIFVDIIKIAFILGKQKNKINNILLLLDTYISPENQNIINIEYLDGTKYDKIQENIHLLGGYNKYYYKYKKYKKKYILLKNNN
jgi:hypothetical protein